MNIFIVRHAESDNNTDGRFYTYTDGDLTPQGIVQAQYCRKELAHIHFDRVYASHLVRAIKTAEIVGRTDHVLQCKELGEMKGGDYEGKTWEELHQLHPYFHLRLMDELATMQFPNGECYEDVKTRLQKFVDQHLIQLQEKEDTNVLIVSHGITLRILINILMKKPDDAVNTIYWADNTAITHIEWKEKPTLHCLLSNDHLIEHGMDRSSYEQWSGKLDVQYEAL